MTIVIDASSLILLSKISVLEKLLIKNKCISPKLVYEEVIKGKEKGRKDSLLIERLFSERKILLENSDKIITNKIRNMYNLKGGELEVVSIAFGKKDRIILSDDRKCINVSKALKIDFITSLDVVVALYKKKHTSREKAINCIEKLEEYGWYRKDIIKYYREVLEL